MRQQSGIVFCGVEAELRMNATFAFASLEGLLAVDLDYSERPPSSAEENRAGASAARSTGGRLPLARRPPRYLSLLL